MRLRSEKWDALAKVKVGLYGLLKNIQKEMDKEGGNLTERFERYLRCPHCDKHITIFTYREIEPPDIRKTKGCEEENGK